METNNTPNASLPKKRKVCLTKSDLSLDYARNVELLKEKWQQRFGQEVNSVDPKSHWQMDLFKFYPILMTAQEKAKQKCSLCGTSETPEWRSGPGFSRLCNACGLREKRKRKILEKAEQIKKPKLAVDQLLN